MFFRNLSLVTLSLLTVAYAQEAAPADKVPPPMVNPPTGETKPAQAPAGSAAGDAIALPPQEAAKPKEPEKKISISLPKATGNDIAQFYRQLTGKRVLVDAEASRIEANIVVFGDGENKDDAVKAFEKALLMNGLAIVPSGENEVKLLNVTANSQQNARVEGIPVIMDEADLPDGDNVVTFVMPLQFILPKDAKTTLEAASGSKLHSYGSITDVPNASVLIITENASVIKRLIELKSRIDKPSQQISSAWVEVKYADVESLATTLEKIVNPQQNNQQQTARRNYYYNVAPPQPAQPAGGKGGDGNQNSAEQTPPQIIPDARTNRLLLLGRSSDLVFLESLVKEFDIPTDTKNSLCRKLKYLSVLDFLPVAQNALERINPQNNDPNKQNQQAQMTARNSRSQQQGNTSTNSSTSGSEMLKNPEESGAPDSLIVGRTLLVADTISNSIVVQGPPQSLQIIGRLLDQIDIRGPQVMISTIFGQFRRTDDREFGLDWVATLKKSGNFSWAGSDFNSSSGWNPTTAEDPSKLSSSLSGLSLYGKFGGNINFLLRAAMSTGRFSVLSRPTIYTENNRRAVIESGQRIAVPTNQLSSVNSSGDGLNQNTSINYKDIVLRLEVIPLVNSEKEVTLQVGQLNDQITGYQKVGGTEGMEVPTISTQKIVTTVTVPNKGTVILGGLITRDVSTQHSGIPILSDIPLLGRAFSSDIDKIEEKEIVIFIQPTIIIDDVDAYRNQVKERSRYQVSPEILDFAEPVSSQLVGDEGLLPSNSDSSDSSYMAPEVSQPDPAPAQAEPSPQTNQQENTPASARKKRVNMRSATRAFGPF